MVTAVTAPSSNESRSSSNASVPVPATSIRNTAALVSAMSSSSPGAPPSNITASSPSVGASSSPVAGPTMSKPTLQAATISSSSAISTGGGVGSVFDASSTSPAVPSTTSPDQSKPTGSPPSTGNQQPSSPTPTLTPVPTPTPQQNGQSSAQPSISTIHSTTVVTKATTATSTSTSTLSTFSKPVVVTQLAQNGSTSVFTPSFVTVLTTSTNSDGSAVTWTGVYVNPTGDSGSQRETFFQNTGTVAGVFTVLGIVVAFIILCAVYLIRRSRRKRRQNGWQSPAASFGRYDSQTTRSVSSQSPSEISRSRMALPTQDYSGGYLPVHVNVVQETEHYSSQQGTSVEAPTQRPQMVSLTRRLSSYSPSAPIPSEPVQETRRWPPEGPFTDAPKRLSLMRDNGPNYLPKIPITPEAGQVSQRLSIERQGPTKMVFPTRDNATSKRPSILVSTETVQRSSTEVGNGDPRKWKVRLAASSPMQQRGNSKPVEEISSSSQSSPSVYPSSLPPIESEDESTTVGEQPTEPTVEIRKQAVSITRPHSAGAPPRPPRSVLRSLSFRGPQSYSTLDSSTPSPSSSTTADSPQAILPRRTLLDVRPRSAPQGTPVRTVSMYQ